MFIVKIVPFGVSLKGLMLFICFVLGGCASIGPSVLERDRLDYADAIARSWEQQMLKNIVKFRYRESLFFLSVASVINQYTFESTASASVTTGGDDSSGLGGAGRYADRPTITYAPIRGRDFIRQTLTPIPPAALFMLARSGWPLDRMFELTVRKVNGVENTSTAGVDLLPNPEFAELMAIIGRLQGSSALDMRVDRIDNRRVNDEVILELENIPDELRDDARRAAVILGIDSADLKYKVIYGAMGASPNEIAVLSRSVMEMMAEFSEGIDVPAEHIESGVAYPSFYDSARGQGLKPPLRIYSSPDRPGNAYVSIQHRDHWYWIADADIDSKESFSFLNTMMQLTADAVTSQSPVLTLGAGN